MRERTKERGRERERERERERIRINVIHTKYYRSLKGGTNLGPSQGLSVSDPYGLGTLPMLPLSWILKVDGT